MERRSDLALVVEDDTAIREAIVEILAGHGYPVHAVGNGAEALEALEAIRPAVLVLDLLMPVMHGWAFMESYLDKVGGVPIPIVVVSANPALPRSFDRFGVRQVVAKPFDVDTLVGAIERAVDPVAA